MELFYRKSGAGSPVVIMHGLYGSGDNWYTVARELATSHTVYLVDQRNHGNSPHHAEHGYNNLSGDLYEFMHHHKLNKAILLGHSMGGKTVLAFGLDHPEMVEKMIVVDISPLGYPENDESPESRMHRHIISSLVDLDINNLTSREEADKLLSTSIGSSMVRQFLLKILKRKRNRKFEWALNLESLALNMPAIFEGIISEETTDPRSIPEFPLLFIKGGNSGYIRQHDMEAIKHFFPHAEIVTISDAGHWVHAEQPERFVEVLKKFI
jgi:pimeloyl-ACP methyl ester carboxylesterase